MSIHPETDFQTPTSSQPDPKENPRNSTNSSHRLDALRRIGLCTAHEAKAQASSALSALYRVVEVQREHLLLHDGQSEHVARPLPALVVRLLAANDALAVGDWVLAPRNALRELWVCDRLSPMTQLARRQNDGRDKSTRTVLVSNVDTALLVMGLDGDFNPRRLERYLALAEHSGVAAAIILNKADLCANVSESLEQVRALLPAHTPLVAVNATDQATSALLAEALGEHLAPGRTLVLLGSSGAGKSTLTNALLGEATQDTGGTRKGDGRGRHTTTVRSLYLTPGGACIIDTPGLRTLRLDSDGSALDAVFSDVAELAKFCRFRDCTHQHEPGCAVRAAVPEARLKNYLKLQREAQRDVMTALQRKEMVAEWKRRGRAGKQRAIDKRGV